MKNLAQLFLQEVACSLSSIIFARLEYTRAAATRNGHTSTKILAHKNKKHSSNQHTKRNSGSAAFLHNLGTKPRWQTVLPICFDTNDFICGHSEDSHAHPEWTSLSIELLSEPVYFEENDGKALFM